MATTKKTVKNDTTDKKKSTTTKKKTTAKKKTNAKKEVESTGVVDEFLNTVVGETITMEEAEKHSESKKIDEQDTDMPSTELTDENRLIDAEAELNEILSQQITEENIRVADAIEKSINEQKELNERLETLGLTEESLSNIKVITDKIDENAETKEPHNVVYPPIAEPTEKETPITVDDLRVNLEANPQQSFTYVNTSMGVKYD